MIFYYFYKKRIQPETCGYSWHNNGNIYHCSLKKGHKDLQHINYSIPGTRKHILPKKARCMYVWYDGTPHRCCKLADHKSSHYDNITGSVKARVKS